MSHIIDAKSAHLQSSAIIAHEHLQGLTNTTHFATRANNITQQAIKHIAEQPQTAPLPDHAWLVATTPVSLGGLGLRNSSYESTISFFITYLRTIRHAHIGVPSVEHRITLPQSLSADFKNWEQSTLKPLKHFKRILNIFINMKLFHIPDHIEDKLLYIIQDMPLNNLQRNFKRKISKLKIKSELETEIKPDDEIKLPLTLPLMLSEYTAIGLTQPSRAIQHNRIKPHHFRHVLRRKLRLPHPDLIGITKCPHPRCNQPLDPYGDHFMSSKCCPKTAAHNKFRNALCTVIKELAPISEDINNKNQIEIEPTNVCPSYPNNRPADIRINLNSSKHHHFRKIAIDVTFIPQNFDNPPPRLQSHSLTTEQVFRLHEKGENSKFRGQTQGNTQIIKELNDLKYIFIPATFDGFGKIGPVITNFLQGPNTPYKHFERNTNRFEPEAKIAAHNATKHKERITNFLHNADKQWITQHNSENAWYTPSHKAKTPSAWAKQYLGLSIINIIGTHMETGVNNTLYPPKRSTTNETNAGTRQDYFTQPSRYQTRNKQTNNNLHQSPTTTHTQTTNTSGIKISSVPFVVNRNRLDTRNEERRIR